MSDWKNVQYKDGKMRTSEGGGGSSTFAGLDDVSFNNIQNGQVPKYNSTTQKWENANESGGGGTVTDVKVDGTSVVNPQTGVAEITMPTPPSVPDEISDLSDVQFNNLADHQPLRYNATSQKWVNGADNYPPLIYSDEEREVGVWRDGKPLYQKTIAVQSNGSDNGREYYDISSLNVDSIISLYGYAKDGLFNRFIPYVYRSDNSDTVSESVCIFYRISTTSLEIVHRGKDYGVGYLIIQYTKTTDTPGSGTWTTQGGYAHHYSTDEKVIGTWVNGKPLYAKSYNTVHISANQSVEVDSFDQRIITIIKMDFIWNVGWASSSDAHYWSAQSVGIDGYNENVNVSGPRVYVQENKLRFKNNSSGGAGIDIRGTIYYTKTTD